MATARYLGRATAFWGRVQVGYEGRDLKVAEVAVKHGLTDSELRAARRHFRWRSRRQTDVARNTIIKRLFRLIDQLSQDLEASVSKTGDRGSGDKEVGVLGQLVTIMGKLIDMEQAEKAGRAPRQTRAMTDIRQRLIDRIEELKRQ